MRQKRILVTGGFGFIGARLTARLLENGHHVTVLDNLSPQIHGILPATSFAWTDHPSVKLLRGNATNPRAIDEALDGVDAVAHLAAETGTGQSMYEIARYSEVNVQATAILLDRIINAKLPVTRFVVASSRSIYGEGSYLCAHCTPKAPITPAARLQADLAAGRWEPICPNCGSALTMVPTAETAPMRPSSVYAATKAAQEDLVRIACLAAGIPAIALRFQNVYGEGQSLKNPYTGVMSILSTRIRRGLTVPLYEDGEESRDFVHVDDAVAALAAALERDFSGFAALNIGSAVATSVRCIAEILIKALDGAQKPVVTRQFRLGDIRHCVADIGQAQRVIGFAPKVTIEDGLRRYAAWVAAQPLPPDDLDRATAELTARGFMSKAET